MRSEPPLAKKRRLRTKAMEDMTMPATLDFHQRTIKPRPRDAFDKCPVLEIRNSALFLGFAFQDIKDIKREIAPAWKF